MTIYKLQKEDIKKYYIVNRAGVFFFFDCLGIIQHSEIFTREFELQEYITKEVDNGFSLEVVRL